MQIKTVYDVRDNLEQPNYFFSKNTMGFFGDTMRSFGLMEMDGKLIMYRKPWVTVNVFGKTKPVGKQFFGAWEVVENDGSLSLERIDGAEKDAIYNIVKIARLTQ